MASIPVSAVSAAFTANGGADGYVTVASNAAFYPGATVWLSSTAVASQEAIVSDLSGSTKIGVRFVRAVGTGPSYGRNDCSAFLAADTAMISMPAQVVPILWAFAKRDGV